MTKQEQTKVLVWICTTAFSLVVSANVFFLNRFITQFDEAREITFKNDKQLSLLSERIGSAAEELHGIKLELREVKKRLRYSLLEKNPSERNQSHVQLAYGGSYEQDSYYHVLFPGAAMALCRSCASGTGWGPAHFATSID